MEVEKILIKNSLVYFKGKFEKLDILIESGKISSISDSIKADSPDIKIINAQGLHTFPGLIDMHVHFREPGFSYKETIKTGSEAAAAGGFTTVCTMPNVKPSPDSREGLEKQLEIIKKDAEIEIIPFATITRKRMGEELVDYESIAPYVAGFSDDGSGVQNDEVMKRAMIGIAKTRKILAAHCEVDSLLDGGYIHKGEYAARHNHKGICSESEWKEVERDIELSRQTGCRLHICHVSTKESVQLIREAKSEGLKVTAETGPHYLMFSDMDLKEDGRFKMNPPIRSEADRYALIKGVSDGTIDVIATDHAPHSQEEKSKGLEKSAMGIVGLETAFPAIYTSMVLTGYLSLEQMAERMSKSPAKILGLQTGEIHPGNPADLLIADLNAEKKVDSSTFKSKGKATPFDGMLLKGWPKITLKKGKIIYNDSDLVSSNTDINLKKIKII